MNIVQAIKRINQGKKEEGKEVITRLHLQECVDHILRLKLRITISEQDAISIYGDGLELFVEKIAGNKFKYINERKAVNYLKKCCEFKAYEYQRLFLSPGSLLIKENDFEKHIEIFIKLFRKRQEEEYNRLNKLLDVPLNVEDNVNEQNLRKIVAAFHKLPEQCKIFFLMKHVAGMSHVDIVDKLAPFYPMASKNVSKTKLHRCMEQLRNLINEMTNDK